MTRYVFGATVRYMDAMIVPITDFIRKFGLYAGLLPKVNKIILTREGRPFAEVKLTPEERNERFLKLWGTWDPKLFSNEKVWKEVLKRKNRKHPIRL